MHSVQCRSTIVDDPVGVDSTAKAFATESIPGSSGSAQMTERLASSKAVHGSGRTATKASDGKADVTVELGAAVLMGDVRGGARLPAQ